MSPLKKALYYGKLLSFGLAGVCLLLSCQLLLKPKKIIPKDLRPYQSGIFSGFVVLNQSSKQRYFTADIAISQKGWLKVDLFASMGLPIMSLLLKDKTGSVIFFQNQQYYSGKNITKMIKKHIPMDISILKDILFQHPPSQKKWECHKSAEGLWIYCNYQKQVIKWSVGKERSLSLQSPQWSFTFHYSAFTPRLEENIFSLKIPSHFTPLP